MKIYVSIPITGHDIEEQRLKSQAAERRIYALGHLPITPFSVTAPNDMSEKETYAYFMGRDIEMLLRCDAVYMADRRWAKSRGCSIEHHAASVMDMEIYYNIEDIPEENGDKSN